MKLPKFSLEKHFIFLFAFFITASTFAFDMMLFHAKAPAENRDIINMIAGVLNTGCLMMVVSFFFGSTSTSREKTKQLTEMASSIAANNGPVNTTESDILKELRNKAKDAGVSGWETMNEAQLKLALNI